MAELTTKQKYANDLYQVLKDLTGLAKMGAAPLNTYLAAVHNSDELLKQIDREANEQKPREEKTDG